MLERIAARFGHRFEFSRTTDRRRGDRRHGRPAACRDPVGLPAAPMRFCSAPSAARSGTTLATIPARSRGCSAYVAHSVCTRILPGLCAPGARRHVPPQAGSGSKGSISYSCANSPVDCISASHACARPWGVGPAPSTRWSTRTRRSAVWCDWPFGSPLDGANWSPPSTRQTCSSRRACGVRSPSRWGPKNRRYGSSISWSIPARCGF